MELGVELELDNTNKDVFMHIAHGGRDDQHLNIRFSDIFNAFDPSHLRQLRTRKMLNTILHFAVIFHTGKNIFRFTTHFSAP